MNEETLSFSEMGLKGSILKGVEAAGFKKSSPVQSAAIPLVLQERDLVAQAHTGTGKTAAFGLPTMSMFEGDIGVELLVITPTRELTMQVSDELFKLGRFAGVRSVTVYGGSSYGRQIGLIERGAQVVVATPGRLLDLLKGGKLRNFNPRFVVLDEADEMLDMGFLDDIKEIFDYLPSNRQTLLFSATMPKPIKILAEEILINPEFVSITKRETTNKDIEQKYYVIEEYERDDAVIRLLEADEARRAILFCRTKSEVDRLSTLLVSIGYQAKGLHGDMEQRQREEVIKSFKSGKIEILIATDVAARGLDVTDLTHVFNYHIPFDPESYVHRIGRTGRAGKKGIAVTLVTPLEFKELQRIKKLVGTTIELCQIPTLGDLKVKQYDNLVKALMHQKIDQRAVEAVEALESEIDIMQIALKLMSRILEQSSIAGPDKIGLDAKKANMLMERANQRGNDRNRGRNNRGGYRGNRGRSGGGGYKGNRDNRNGGGRDNRGSGRNSGNRRSR